MSTTRFNKSLFVMAALAAGVAGAQAQGLRSDSFYVGGNLGHTHWKDPINGVSGEASNLDGKLYGGYQLNPNFAVEVGTMALGRIDNGTGTAKAYGGFVDGVGTLPIGQSFSLLGRAGLAETRFKTNNGNSTSPAIKVGAGIQYDLSKTMALRGEWERYHQTSAFGGNANADQYSVGLKVGF